MRLMSMERKPKNNVKCVEQSPNRQFHILTLNQQTSLPTLPPPKSMTSGRMKMVRNNQETPMMKQRMKNKRLKVLKYQK